MCPKKEIPFEILPAKNLYGRKFTGINISLIYYMILIDFFQIFMYVFKNDFWRNVFGIFMVLNDWCFLQYLTLSWINTYLICKHNIFIIFVLELLTIPPGFNRGLVFNEDGQSLINKPDENRKKKTFGDLPNVNLFELIWNETGTVG